MVYKNSQPKKTVIAFLVSQSIFCTSAFAAGFQLNEISPSLQGDATAGAAAAKNDVSSMFINPATLATLEENQGYLGINSILPHVKMSNAKAVHSVFPPGPPPSEITAQVQGKNSQGSISPSVTIPASYASYRINDKLVAGLAVLAPFGLRTKYEPDSVVRFAAQYSSVQTFDVNPALAYMINDKWSVGAGFQAQYILATFSNFNGPYTGSPLFDPLVAADYPTHLKADSWGYGFNLGVLFKPEPNTRVGLGYRSRISESLKGTGQQYIQPGATVPAESVNDPFNASTYVNGKVTTPDVLTLSAAHDIDKWTVKASAQINFWSTFNQLAINMPQAYAFNSTIQTQWRDVWFGALGAEYHATPLWTVRAGVAYDETPTRDEFRDPRIPDANRVWATAGATYMLNKSLSIDAAYEHIFMQAQTVNVVQASGVSATSTLPLEVNKVSANYTGSADILAIAMRYSFN